MLSEKIHFVVEENEEGRGWREEEEGGGGCMRGMEGREGGEEIWRGILNLEEEMGRLEF